MANKRGSGSYDYIESQDRWRWRGYYLDPITGKRKIKSLYNKSKKQLREKVEEWLLQSESGLIEVDMTLAKWVDVWLRTVIGDSVKIRTKEIYTHILLNHVVPRFGSVKLSRITAQPYQEYLNELSKQYSPNTVATIRRYTIMCLDCAVRYGYIINNPIRNTRPPRQVKKEIVALSQEQTDLIIDIALKGAYQKHPHHDDGAQYLRDCYYTIIVVAVDTGMRKGEILGLRWDDLGDGYIIVKNNLITAKTLTALDSPKTATSARKIILGSRCSEVLREWREKQKKYAAKYVGIFQNKFSMVFTNAFGNFVSVTNFSRRCWKPLLNKASLEGVRFHDLRHAHASQLLAAGVSPQIVSQRLGHSDLGVTLKVYAHLLPNMQESARDQIDKVFGGKVGEEKNE